MEISGEGGGGVLAGVLLLLLLGLVLLGFGGAGKIDAIQWLERRV